MGFQWFGFMLFLHQQISVKAGISGGFVILADASLC